MDPLRLYEILLDHYGRQDWWPADTPFEVAVGAVLTQNTAWKNVEKAISNLKARGLLSPEKILACEDLEALIRPAGFYRQKAERLRALCRKILEYGSMEEFLDRETKEVRADLLSVKGIGYETADAILLYAGNHPVFVVDRYTHRIFTRTGLWEGKYDYEAIREFVEAHVPNKYFKEFHALIDEHAKALCRKEPRCEYCFVECRYKYDQRER